MKNLIILAFTLFLFSLSLSSCITKRGRDVQQTPEPLSFVIRKNGERLNDNVTNNLKLYYFKNGNKNYSFQYTSVVPTISYYTLEDKTIVQQFSVYIANESAAGIKDYYLEYPNGDVDNIQVDYQKFDYDEAVKDPCYCFFKLIEVKFNGVCASYDQEIKKNIYRFDKLN